MFMQTMPWTVLGKMFPEKCPLKIVPTKIAQFQPGVAYKGVAYKK